jgi:uncharacterized membrane protein
MFVAAIWVWPSAPAQIPIHWNLAGQINGYGSKFTGLLLLPAIALAGYALIGLVAIIRPEQFDERALSALSWFRLTYLALLAGIHFVIVIDIRGGNFNINYIIFSLLAVVVLTSANLIQQFRRLKATRTAPPGGGIQI